MAAILAEYGVGPPLCFVADNCSAAVSANTKLVDMTDEVIPELLRVDDEDIDVDVDDAEYTYLAPESDAVAHLRAALHLPTDSIGCHCHALELAIGDALKATTVRDIIADLKDFICAYKKSSRTQNVIRSVCGEGEKLPFLPQDVSTRWTSTFRMIDAFISKLDIFDRANEKIQSEADLADVPGAGSLDSITNKKERRLLMKLRDLLQPLAKAVDTLQGDTYPTLSLVQIFATALHKRVLKLEEEEQSARHRSDTFLQVLNTLGKSLRDRLLWPRLPLNDGYVPIEYVAAALDCRTKKLEFLRDESERDEVWKHIVQVVKKTELNDAPTQAEQLKPHEQDALQALLQEYDTGESKYGAPSADDEVAAYRAESSGSADPLQWWRLAEAKYPRLFLLARNYLAVPASSATVERIFSRAGNVLSLKRMKLSEDTLQANTCFKINEKFEKYATKVGRSRDDTGSQPVAKRAKLTL